MIDTIVRDGARRMLAAAVHAEVDAYIAEFAEQRDEHGRRLVVRIARGSRGVDLGGGGRGDRPTSQ